MINLRPGHATVFRETRGGRELCSLEANECLHENLLKMRSCYSFSFSFFLVGYVEERLWWPIQSPNTGEMKKASC